MTVLIFAGPTLGRSEIEAAGFCWRPPVARGDVWRALQEGLHAIGIIDGYFEAKPAVWHKEILWALTQGVVVFGAASMGALRAAEMHPFGMRGIGHVFEAFRDGKLTEDDEVAVLHAPAEAGFLPLSDAMVDIRATVTQAAATNVVEEAFGDLLLQAAKSLHYKERTWPGVLRAARAAGADADALHRYELWLPGGRVNRKRLDALALLEAIRAFLDAGEEAPRPSFRFEWTEFWEAFTVAEGSGSSSVNGPAARDGAILDELRLDAAGFKHCRERALLRLLLLDSANRRRALVAPDAPAGVLGRLRRRLGHLRRADFEAWRAECALDAAALTRLFEEEALIEAEARRLQPSLAAHLLTELKLAGRYGEIARRARAKAEALATAGLEDPRLADANITPAHLRAWYFEHKLMRSIPDDLEAWLAAHGYADRDDFDRLLLNEWLYCRQIRQASDHQADLLPDG